MIEYSQALKDAVRGADWSNGAAAITGDRFEHGIAQFARNYTEHYAGPWGTLQVAKDIARLLRPPKRQQAQDAILAFLDARGFRRVLPGEDGSPTRLWRIEYGGERWWIAADSLEQCLAYARKECCEPDAGDELKADDVTATHLNERVCDTEGDVTFYTMRYIMAQVDPPGLVASTVGP